MSPYITHKEMREFEDEFGWENIKEGNKTIGIALNFKPHTTYAVGDDDGYCYSPDNNHFSDENSQKREAERWLNEQITKYPDGHVARDGYKVIKFETYPSFHRDWNELIEALKRIEKQGFVFVCYSYNIFKTWKLLYNYIKAENETTK